MRIALLALIVLPAIAAWVAGGIWPGLADDPWPLLAVAGVLGVTVAAAKRRSAVLILVAFGLAAVGAQAAAKSRAVRSATQTQGAEGGWPFFDLTQGPLPDPAPSYISVQGFYRNGWTLDEYDPAPGQIPDQSKAPRATLVPLLGDDTGLLTPDQQLVVARVAAGTNLDAGRATVVRGKVRPLDPIVLATLIQAAEGVDPATLRGVVIDTLEVPAPREVWTNLGVALGACFIGLVCLWFATGTPTEAELASE